MNVPFNQSWISLFIVLIFAPFSLTQGQDIDAVLSTLQTAKNFGNQVGAECHDQLPEYQPTVDLSLRLINDNKPYGLSDGNLGDDLGHTHGYKLETGITTAQKIRIYLFLHNDLFTEQSGKSWRDEQRFNFVPQHFTEEIKAGLGIDTFENESTFYVSGQAGWHHLNSTPNDNLLLSTGKQQTEFHHAINESKIFQFNERLQRDNGLPGQIGFFVSGSAGLKQQIFNFYDGLFELVVYSDMGLELSTIPGTQNILVRPGMVLSSLTPNFGLGRLEQKLELELPTSIHKDGVLSTVKSSLSLGHQNAQILLEWEKPMGTKPTYRRYDNVNVLTGTHDDMLTIGLKLAI